MKQIKMTVSYLIFSYYIVLASFWAFVVCGGFVVSTLMPIISIIQIFDFQTESTSTKGSNNYGASTESSR